jgi:DNA replication protein DnaC
MERHQIEMDLKSLRLSGMVDNLTVRLREAEANDLGYQEFLGLLVQDERSRRNNSYVRELIRKAGFSGEKTFEGFDFSFNRKAFPERALRDLMTCAFVDLGQHVVIAGPPGIGKTHIAKALGHEACRRKKRVHYSNVYDLFDRLSRARTESYYERVFKNILLCDVLILDDFGLRPFSTKESELLYNITDARAESRSVILTSNRPPEDWIKVFPDPVIGGAILDRLVAGAIKIMVKNDARSYRKEGGLDKSGKKGDIQE